MSLRKAVRGARGRGRGCGCIAMHEAEQIYCPIMPHNAEPNDILLRDAIELLADVRPEFLQEWHWFRYHAQVPTSFMISIVLASLSLRRIGLEAPRRMLSELAAIRGRDRFQPHYDQLLQKLSEILVMQQAAEMPWPEGTSFQIEGIAPGSDRRVDLVAELPDGHKYGFEVKCAAYLAHAERRVRGGIQIPARGPDGLVEIVRENEENVVLPRDNTIRDFLRSADQKFAAFKAAGRFTGALVIVWDDHIYEAIGPLVNDRNGLLTNASYSRKDGVAETFPNVDGVVLMRHLSYLTQAAAERPLPDDRVHAMHVGGEGALPNVFISIPGAAQPSPFVLAGFHAMAHDDPALQNAADYLANDMIIWV